MTYEKNSYRGTAKSVTKKGTQKTAVKKAKVKSRKTTIIRVEKSGLLNKLRRVLNIESGWEMRTVYFDGSGAAKSVRKPKT